MHQKGIQVGLWELGKQFTTLIVTGLCKTILSLCTDATLLIVYSVVTKLQNMHLEAFIQSSLMFLALGCWL